jgi:hypothetical protein
MVIKMKSKNRVSAVTLQKGQIWRLEDSHIQIVEIGKNLTHYKRFNNLKQKGVPTKLERTRAVEEYLKAQRATLVNG